MEAEKSYDRPSISWRDWDAGRFAHTSLKTSEPGKLMVELCVQGWRPGDPGGCWFQPWVLISKGRRKSPAQGEREEIAILLPVLFLTGTPTDCWHHPHGGWVFPLSPPASSQANLLWKQLFWLPKKSMIYQFSRYSSIQLADPWSQPSHLIISISSPFSKAKSQFGVIVLQSKTLLTGSGKPCSSHFWNAQGKLEVLWEG